MEMEQENQSLISSVFVLTQCNITSRKTNQNRPCESQSLGGSVSQMIGAWMFNCLQIRYLRRMCRLSILRSTVRRGQIRLDGTGGRPVHAILVVHALAAIYSNTVISKTPLQSDHSSHLNKTHEKMFAVDNFMLTFIIICSACG